MTFEDALKAAGIARTTVLVNRDGVLLVVNERNSFPTAYGADYLTPVEWMLYFDRVGGAAYAKVSPAELRQLMATGAVRRVRS